MIASTFIQIARLSLIAITLTVSTVGMAQGKKSKKSKETKQQVVDTLTTQQFSYALGMANAKGLNTYLVTQLGLDQSGLDFFARGFDIDPNSAEAKTLLAVAAGVQIRKQVEESIFPQAEASVSPTQLSLQEFRNAFKASANNDEQVMSADSAEAIVTRELERRERLANDSVLKVEEDYLRLSAKKKGVKTTSSGLQYSILEKGNGAVPQLTDKVKVHYEGRLTNGTVFDSSYQRGEPATFACNQVIKGWTEALTMMPVGSKWEIVIPQELGYGSRGAGEKIPPYSTLLFTVELLEIIE